ncbi:FAD-dependent monooxygenase [Fontisphaera persica]|uniref:FAD-dependent monooxygenase n=1 Tax=Fontisphaera persica TaxID=2974023 RepID=UPI0024C0B733|nr:FAD-dependent monooxygenase [Fontisphaera persica]WCJ59899.1 FAD-dependent monooxygenase [Fontisphaera persica]
MRKYEQTDVLVVGAGPSGMVAALTLAREGVPVMVVDQEWRRAARSYACALHGRTLRLLAELGLGGELLSAGWRIERQVFYLRHQKVGEVRLDQLGGGYPYVLVIPQSELEGLLEKALRQMSHVQLLWNHRLASLVPETTEVLSTVEKLAESATGYIVPTWDWVVKESFLNHANYVVGADGQHSYVRRAMGIEWQAGAAPETYEIFEFILPSEAGHEALVVLEENGLSYYWPLGPDRGRWAFSKNSRAEEEFQPKLREPVQVVHRGPQDVLVGQLSERLKQRAPFFKVEPQEVVWHGQVRFERRVARRFGVDRCWLAGDAAHQTGPAGMQSMNAGLWEAHDLGRRLARVLRQQGGRELFEEYHQQHQRAWQALLGLQGGLQCGPTAEAWVTQHLPRLQACLPALGEDLGHLATQLGLVWHG